MANRITIKKANKQIGQKVDDFIKDVAIDLSNELKQEAPVHSGRLRNSIQVQKGKTGYVVGPKVDYASDIQFGTDPFDPPIEPLKKWARRKLGEEKLAWAVRAKIKREGITANPFVSRAIDNLEAKYG